MHLTDKMVIKLSKFLSLILRHKPENIGINLDNNGWCDLDELVSKLRSHGGERWKNITLETIDYVTEHNNKKRFTIKNGRIRAAQGHTTKAVDLEFKQIDPAHDLYHGTSRNVCPQIRENGLLPMQRHYVHLSADKETAYKVGKRHDQKPVIFKIDTIKAKEEGIIFYLSDNNVFLCKHVPFFLLEETE